MIEKFKLGQVVITANADNTVNEFDVSIALNRHSSGDWGKCCRDDRKINDDAVKNGNDRIFSVYRDSNGVKFWIITEYNRSLTTVLLPEDY
jgi:hypothetical protein